MELLSTVDWLVHHERAEANVEAVRTGISKWPGDDETRKRKLDLFDERVVAIALKVLAESKLRVG